MPSTSPRQDRRPAEAAGQRATRLGSGRATVVLLVVLLLLVAVAAGESWYLWLRDEPAASAGRPVVTGRLAQQAAVTAASSATEEILSRSYKDFDDQVDRATSKMTDSYAEEFRTSVDGLRADFVRARTELRVVVRAAGVVRASSQRVQALLFLDQYVRKAGRAPTTTPYRALVTVVHTEHGWLVSDIETR